MKRSVGLVVTLCSGLFVAGCATYYKATDPQSGKVYYTQDVEDVEGGAVKLKDARSGSVVTLQTSEIKEIDEDEYEAGLSAPAPAAPSPAPSEAK